MRWYVGAVAELTDPGPIARFAAVVANPSTPEVIVQRLSAGESLKEIARSWGVPEKRFLAWIAANGELSEQCRRVRELAGIELRMEGLEIVDEMEGANDPGAIAAAKLRAEYRERLARDLNRPLFGKQSVSKVEVTVDLGERLRRARERVVDAVPADALAPVEVGAATQPAPVEVTEI